MESWCRASCWRLTEGICQVPDITQPASVPPGTEPHGRNAAPENISIGVVGSQEDAWYAQSGLWTDTNQMAVAPSGGSWLVPGRGVDILGNTVEGGPQKFTSSAVTLPAGAGSGLDGGNCLLLDYFSPWQPLPFTSSEEATSDRASNGGLPLQDTDEFNAGAASCAPCQQLSKYRSTRSFPSHGRRARCLRWATGQQTQRQHGRR